MLKITSIEKCSPAADSGFKKNDHIVSINGNLIEDALDFNFYSADDELEIILVRSGVEAVLKAGQHELEGIETEELRIKHCGNKCVFCFIDQNPKDLRKTLYIKDEDYRYSFLYGNYFTLTNLTSKDIDKILKMRLSPLYVSVHATDQDVRKVLLGLKKDDEFERKLRVLVDGGIEIHTQIVMCPGINNGKVLRKTISDLAAFHPGVRSVAVVPVGLTSHREKLPSIPSVSEECASETLDIIAKFNKKFLKELGTNFVFGADELYLKSGKNFPSADYYEGYLQYEDGIGMTRFFIDAFEESKKGIPKSVRTQTTVKIVTGELFYPVLEKYVLTEFNKVKKLNTELVKVENTIFGKSVTVAGLLSGEDIIRAAGKAENGNDILLIPSTCINSDGLLLDDLTISDIARKTGYRVIYIEDPAEVFDKL